MMDEEEEEEEEEEDDDDDDEDDDEAAASGAAALFTHSAMSHRYHPTHTLSSVLARTRESTCVPMR